jgi:CO2 hydration protein
MADSNGLGPSKHPLADFIHKFESGNGLLVDDPDNVMEVVGVLDSYGVILDAYSNNLIYIADHQFLLLFPFFKYFNGEFSVQKLLKHWFHDRINYEYAEYCMKAMLWHGGGGLADYVESPEFDAAIQPAIAAHFKNNPFMWALHRVFPDFVPEQIRQLCYYSALGQFWRVMSDIFASLADRYNKGNITSIPQVIQHILDGLVADAARPITYHPTIRGNPYPIMPESLGITFLMDTGVPYVEAVFFRGTPFPGTISYNAQVYQVPYYQGEFAYGALYADPLPIGGSGIPPTQLMQDMSHYIPDYLHQVYQQGQRGEDDILVQICQSFQKSMFCVTSAAIEGLAPFPLRTDNLEEKQANRKYLEQWMDRFTASRIQHVNA